MQCEVKVQHVHRMHRRTDASRSQHCQANLGDSEYERPTTLQGISNDYDWARARVLSVSRLVRNITHNFISMRRRLKALRSNMIVGRSVDSNGQCCI